MHRLHLLRHAKSRRDGEVEDRERPLSGRGREEARAVGETLPASLGPPDLVLCSPALRTRETAELVLAAFRPSLRIVFEDELYLSSAETLLRRLLRIGGGNVLVIGHNPGLHELAIKLAMPDSPGFREMALGKFPTLARASFEIDGRWANLGRTPHRLIDYVTPKSLGDHD